MLNDEEKRVLRDVAFDAMQATLAGRPARTLPTGGVFDEVGSAFVTLRKRGALRGCIGLIGERSPLVETVADAARRALTDPRFSPVTEAELADLDFEVSVLSPFRRLEDPMAIEVGLHGLYLTHGLSSGLLLPQVAVEQDWNREEFLSQCAVKAGLAPGAWRDPETRVVVFTAEVF